MLATLGLMYLLISSNLCNIQDTQAAEKQRIGMC